MNRPILILACGALAKEIKTLKELNSWDRMGVQYLPASWHNSPDLILEGLRKRLDKVHQQYNSIFVAYADCGSGGQLDELLEEYGIERLPGAHCYDFFSGIDTFAEISEEEPGTFYLTDFLVRSFKRLVLKELGLDIHPELRNEYFHNYRRVVYLAQTVDQDLEKKARDAAQLIGLEFHYRFTGYGELKRNLEHIIY